MNRKYIYDPLGDQIRASKTTGADRLLNTRIVYHCHDEKKDNMKLTPLHLEIFLHHAVCPDDFPRKSETISEYTHDLISLELLEFVIKVNETKLTNKGSVYLEALLTTPMPIKIERWEMPK